MPKGKTGENASLYYEGGQTPVAMAALTDSGDHQKFTSPDKLWSLAAGAEPVVRPDGLVSGGAIVPNAAADKVDAAALTCYLAGALRQVDAAAAVSASRGSGTDVCRITSITVNASGQVVAVAGAAGPTISETRGGNGGPPLIPVGSIEIGQVRLSSIASAVVQASEIYQVDGVHQERYDSPIWDEQPEEGAVRLLAPLPQIHVGPSTKRVYASYSKPIFSEISPVKDFVAPEKSYSTSSEQYYGATVGSTSSSLGQGSFEALLKSGVRDALVKLKGKNLWFKFFPDRYVVTDYVLCQGILGVSRTFPANANISAKCTISAAAEAVDVSA